SSKASRKSTATLVSFSSNRCRNCFSLNWRSLYLKNSKILSTFSLVSIRTLFHSLYSFWNGCLFSKIISSFSGSQFSIAHLTSRFLRIRILSCFTTNRMGARPIFDNLSFLISKLYLIVTDFKLGGGNGGRI